MMKTLTLALLIGPAAAAQAQSQSLEASGFCAELRRVVAAAAETPPFRSLAAHRPGAASKPDNGTAQSAAPGPSLDFAEPCRVFDDAQGRRFVCYQYFAPETLGEAALVADTARCLPDATRAPEAAYPPGTRFRLGAATIRINEQGTRGGHIGRQVYLVVTRE